MEGEVPEVPQEPEEEYFSLEEGAIISVLARPARRSEGEEGNRSIAVADDGRVILFSQRNPLTQAIKPGLIVRARVVKSKPTYYICDPIVIVHPKPLKPEEVERPPMESRDVLRPEQLDI